MTRYQTRFQMMGTFIDLVLYHPEGEQLIKEAYLRLSHYAQRFTVNQPDSELMEVNKNAGIEAVLISKQGETHVTQGLVDDGRNVFVRPENPVLRGRGNCGRLLSPQLIGNL